MAAMPTQTQNGAPRVEHGALEAQLDAIKDEVVKLIDHVTEGRVKHRPRLREITDHATDTIKAHPIAAVAAALALGYLVVRTLRR
jgi:hypothetical protein